MTGAAAMTSQEISSKDRRSRAWQIAYAVILILALVTRLYTLGHRATSHDETTHAKYSWNLYSGRGFQHDPLMHGPLLFEASAFFYFLFGVSDFSARLYAALAGVVLILSPWLLRKWLGRLGALLASVMLLISPSITYYSRYTRHDIPLLVGTILFLWAVLKYFDSGQARWLRWMAGAFALLYVTKENAYMLTAIFGALLAAVFLWRVLSTRWAHPHFIRTVLILLALAVLTIGFFGLSFRAAQFQEEGEGNTAIGDISIPLWGRVSLGVALSLMITALIFTVRGLGTEQIGRMRVFDVLMVIGTLTLPLSSAMLMRFIVDLDMTTFYGALMSASLTTLPTQEALGAILSLLVCVGAAVGLGLWWNRKQWPILAVICYGMFFIFYSTFFTWGWGVVTGLVGGLAYWMAQQAVERGSQPWFYYLMIGSLYEYLPLLLSLGGGLTLGARALGNPKPRRPDEDTRVWIEAPDLIARIFPVFLAGWAILSWIAYIVAGEKMPWLFVHIAFPHILLAAWALDQWFSDLGWEDISRRGRWLIPVGLLLLLLAWIALSQSSGALSQILGQRGSDGELTLTLSQLQPLGKLIGGAIGLVAFGALVIWTLNRQSMQRALQFILLSGVVLLGGLTARTMMMLNYVNDELAKEYMVYAHATPDVNRALDEIERVSWRETGSVDQVQVAYGSGVAWPFYWYMDSRYPNNYYFVVSSDSEEPAFPDPERLLESPVILAAREEWAAVESVIGDQYTTTEYNHIWWPVEHYKQLTWERLREILSDPEMRAALWDIIFWRDYRRYARLRNPDDPFTLQDWPHRMEFRIYVRTSLKEEGGGSYRLENGKVTVGQPGLSEPDIDDPFGGITVEQSADWRVTLEGARGRGIVRSGGTLYATDPATHQVWRLSDAGTAVDRWGGYGAAPGAFNAPWDVAVGSDGYLYVADTWNHRIQKLNAQGQPVLSWGRHAQVTVNDSSTFGAFYGPRSVVVSPTGDVYVADTGNDRVQVFDAEGTFLRWIGGSGSDIGQLNEPTGIALGDDGELYVADAWNARIQVFDAVGQFLRSWRIPSWQRLDTNDKPFLAYADGRVWATDPGLGRLLAFTPQGAPDMALVDSQVQLNAAGLAVAEEVLYVTSPQTGEVAAYTIPTVERSSP